jgi:hypothetical protein
MRKIYLLLVLFIITKVSAQELNCTVTVNYSQVTNVNPQVFKNLEKSISDFVNKNAWTDKNYEANEKINCSMFITIIGAENNSFSATLQVQSTRPVYNSTYASPLLNLNDKEFEFQYIEFQNLLFNPNNFDSNLISTLAYYCYLIIGVDADSFAQDGGSEYLQKAQDIANLAMPTGVKGWSQTEKTQNKYFLINDMLSPTFKAYREAIFNYHFNSLDKMNADLKGAKQGVADAINSLVEIHELRPNAYITRIFFDAKTDEIVSIFSGGPSIEITKLSNNLNRISPTNAVKWQSVKF